jgi:hypothetical protein
MNEYRLKSGCTGRASSGRHLSTAMPAFGRRGSGSVLRNAQLTLKSVSIAVALALSLLWSNWTLAAKSELTYGRHFALCHAYAKNLRSFSDLSRNTHEWPLDPALKEFRKPGWRRVDPRQHIAIIKTMYIWHIDPHEGLDYTAVEARWKEEEPKVLALIDQDSVRLEMAHVDFDADGTMDRAYRYYHPIQSFTNGAPPIYGYSYLYFQDEDKEPAAAWRLRAAPAYDSFLFRGRFYLIAWSPLGLTILEPKLTSHGIALPSVCSFNLKT